MTVTVVGLGKIGLPLAVQFARKGEMVLGADINEETVDLINQGIEPFPEEENLQTYLTEVVQSGKLSASTNTAKCVSESNVVVVVVPLFVNANAEPDFRAMDSATEEISKGLKKGTLVAYETTLPVGTTRNRFTRILEKNSGLTVGKDFYVVFSPERVLTGRVFGDLRKYPKILGGADELSTKIGAEFYRRVLDFDERSDLDRPNGVWEVDSLETAEFVKLAETTYRDVNIGLANQFAKFADSLGLNVYDVIEASNSQPYSHIHQPGIAVGGHCIPIYPQFYLWNDPKATIVEAARRQNEEMPEYALSQIESKIGALAGSHVLILGASYRANVKELAFSGVFKLYEEILKRGGTPVVWDRVFTPNELASAGLDSFDMPSQNALIEVVIVQNSDYKHRDLLRQEFPNLKMIYDGRNISFPFTIPEGVNWKTLGKG